MNTPENPENTLPSSRTAMDTNWADPCVEFRGIGFQSCREAAFAYMLAEMQHNWQIESWSYKRHRFPSFEVVFDEYHVNGVEHFDYRPSDHRVYELQQLANLNDLFDIYGRLTLIFDDRYSGILTSAELRPWIYGLIDGWGIYGTYRDQAVRAVANHVGYFK